MGICSKTDSMVLINLRGNAYVQKGDIEDALNEYNKVLKILSKNGQDKITEGLTFLNEGNTEKAKDCFNEALKLNPESNEAYIQLANIYEKKGLRGISIILKLQIENNYTN